MHTAPASQSEMMYLVSRKDLLIFLTQEERIRLAQRAIDILNMFPLIPHFEDHHLLDSLADFRHNLLEAIFCKEELSSMDFDDFIDKQQIIIN